MSNKLHKTLYYKITGSLFPPSQNNFVTMPATRTNIRHAKISYEQKKASQRRQEDFLDDIMASRDALSETINKLAKKHDKYATHI